MFQTSAVELGEYKFPAGKEKTDLFELGTSCFVPLPWNGKTFFPLFFF